MDLSHEETMRRIEEWERTDYHRVYCKEQKFPYYIHVYWGEGQVVVVPLVTAAGRYNVEMAWHLQIKDVKNAKLIGEKVLEAVEHIKVSPVDARTEAERQEGTFMTKITTCKTFKELHKKYLYCTLVYREDATFTIYPSGHNYERNIDYDGDKNKAILPADSSAKKIGDVLLEQFAQMEAFYQSRKRQRPSRPRITIETISAGKLSFEELQDEHYLDEEDYGVGEVYQGYSYNKESSDESVADLYYSIAAELDCDISDDNIRRVYEKLYGEDARIEITNITHPVFEKRMEVIGKEIHHITYVKQVDESELLACELNLKIKLAGKRIYNKVLKDFEKMVESARTE